MKICDCTLKDLARKAGADKRGGGRCEDHLKTDCGDLVAARVNQGEQETPTGHARRSELMDIAHRVLSADEYEAWYLVGVLGCTSEEAADRLNQPGRSASAVRGMVARARAKIVSWLQNHRLE
ncbi:MAG: hypothetical protein Fur0037_21920 [Planctomycetota bacterium]